MIPIRATWLVVTIFALQTVLLGAAPRCDCAPRVEVSQAQACCADQDHTCCSVKEDPGSSTEPATVAVTSTVQFVATATGTAQPPTAHSRPTLLKLTAEPHPTGLWSELFRAERAPPLS